MRFLREDTAVSEVIGHAIILGLTITGVAMITLVGMPTILKLQDMANIRNVEQSYAVLDSRLSKVSLGEAPSQGININPAGGSISSIPNASSSTEQSYVLIELKNATGVTTSFPIPMGKIVYRLGERDVAYEGGGVWSKYPEGSVMLSPPTFDYNGVTLTLPVINISGNFSAGGNGASSLNLAKIGSPQVIYPNATYQNPVSENITQVNITIRSEYYDAWADYFRSKSLIQVNEVPSAKKVIITLVTPPVVANFSYGALSSDSIEVDENAQTDSYNSSKGPYSVSKSRNGSIRAARTIEVDNNAVVNGSALTGGDITGGNQGKILKDAYARTYGSVQVLGTKYPQVAGLSVGSTTSTVQGKINDYKTFNNNNGSSANGCLRGAGNSTLDGTGTNWSGGSTSKCTMYPGNYYLSTFSLSNKQILIFETGTGAVNIATDSTVILDNKVNITVSGSNPVRLYLNKLITIGNDVQINPTSNDTSNRFQVISSSPQDITFGNNAYFCGFIWAPTAAITISNNAMVYGAMIGKTFTLTNGQQMHYDEALQSLDTPITTGTTVMYLYVTRNDVTASIS